MNIDVSFGEWGCGVWCFSNVCKLLVIFVCGLGLVCIGLGLMKLCCGVGVDCIGVGFVFVFGVVLL